MATQFMLICFAGVAIFAQSVQSGCISGVSSQTNPKHTSCLSDSSRLSTAYPASSSDKTTILSAHNAYRSSSALSPTPNPSIADLQWNDELATTAQEWANQCDSDNDDIDARNVPAQGWTVVQQSIAVGASSSSYSYSQAIASWGAQKPNFKYGTGASPSKSKITNYVQMIWSKTTNVGCGAAQCTSISGSSSNKYIVVCNYGPGQNLSALAYPYENRPVVVADSHGINVSPMLAALIASFGAAVWIRN